MTLRAMSGFETVDQVAEVNPQAVPAPEGNLHQLHRDVCLAEMQASVAEVALSRTEGSVAALGFLIAKLQLKAAEAGLASTGRVTREVGKGFHEVKEKPDASGMVSVPREPTRLLAARLLRCHDSKINMVKAAAIWHQLLADASNSGDAAAERGEGK